MTEASPNHPAAGKAEIERVLAIEHYWLDLSEPGRSAKHLDR
jgi:hypothetical protein